MKAVSLGLFLLSIVILSANLSRHKPDGDYYFFSYVDASASANQKERAKEKKMSEIVSDTLLTILGGVISGCVGIFAFAYERHRSACRAYYVAMCDIGCRAIEAAKSGAGEEFYRATLNDVRKEVLTLYPVLFFKDKELLGRWLDYSKIIPGDLDKQSSIDRAGETVAGGLPPTKGSRIIEIHFKRFIEVVREDFVGFEPEKEIDPLHPDYKTK